ncbi:hypothetical protein HDU89_000703, partial [Geranomyces variabilis]
APIGQSNRAKRERIVINMLRNSQSVLRGLNKLWDLVMDEDNDVYTLNTENEKVMYLCVCNKHDTIPQSTP